MAEATTGDPGKALMPKTLVVIPAYNEELCIEQVMRGLIATCPDVDYIIINDGSSDDTSAICRKHGYNLIDLPINLGLANAFQTGMRYAYHNGYDCAIQFDADGQHRPEYIKPLAAATLEHDIVIGSRFCSEKRPHSLRMFGSSLLSGAIAMTTGKTIHDPTSGMRAYNRRMIGLLATCKDLGPEPDTLALLINRSDANVGELQVAMRERIAGESYLNLRTSSAYMIRMTLSILIIQFVRKITPTGPLDNLESRLDEFMNQERTITSGNDTMIAKDDKAAL